MIAGPNGAGKTTYAFRHIRAVSGTAQFVNLDEIARGLAPLAPELARQRAARVALDMTADFIRSGVPFSIERTLAGRTHLRTLKAARDAGFKVVLLYFSPDSVETCLARVARRVSEGGHDVPEPDVRRRFIRSAANLPAYAQAANLWRVFDTGSLKVRTAAEGKAGCVSSIEPAAVVAPAVRAWIDGLPPCAEG
ncbi:MAG: AAA family ATPase [Beijerinckiaceae bacterium]